MNRTYVFASLALLLAAGSARADEWRFGVTPYAWATDIGVDATLGGRQVVDKTIPVSDLMSQLDTIFQVRLEAQHRSLGAMVDVFDVTLSDEKQGVALPQGRGQADLRSHVGMTIIDVAGVYDAKADGRGFLLLVGSRVIDQRATIDASLALAGGPTVPQTYETGEWLVDALFGLRFSQGLSRHWGVRVQADVSTGGTDYTWSIAPSLSYAFGASGRYELTAGYRRMVIDFPDEGELGMQQTLSGALVGFRVSF
jgi:hypothetical protein